MPALTSIQMRRGTAAQWSAANPVLAVSEPGFETDSGRFKLGDGVKAWTALGYFGDDKASVSHTHTSSQITDSTVTGRAVLTAASAASARSAIGAGTSDLALGTTGTTAMAGNKTFAFAEITGTLGTNQLPPLAINDTFVVASQAAMLALTAQRGDIAIRTDVSVTFVLATDSPSTLADWKEILTTGAVVSVAGKTGAVTLGKADVGLGNVDNTADVNKPVSTAQQSALNAKENTIAAGTTAQYFRGDKTWVALDKAAVGLSAVDNTSDLNKPVSTAVSSALAAKAPLDSPSFSGTVTLPGTTNGLSKNNVGLGNVDNTSDINKPVSTAAQTALNGKANVSHTHVSADISSIDGGTP